jgi:transposase
MKEHITIGMDLGNRSHIVVIIDDQGNEIECRQVVNTKVSMKRFFRRFGGATVAIEAGTHSPWISRLLEDLGCRVYVGNPHKLRVIWDSVDKSDARDARMLAMVCRLEPKLLWPVRHRNAKAHSDLELIKARDMLVKTRVGLINPVRSVVKGIGERLPKCSTASFASRSGDRLPEKLRPTLDPLVETLGIVTGENAGSNIPRRKYCNKFREWGR